MEWLMNSLPLSESSELAPWGRAAAPDGTGPEGSSTSSPSGLRSRPAVRNDDELAMGLAAVQAYNTAVVPRRPAVAGDESSRATSP